MGEREHDECIVAGKEQFSESNKCETSNSTRFKITCVDDRSPELSHTFLNGMTKMKN
jgi:hypothetical protein